MKPSIGRIVHYVMPEGEHRAAIITFVHSGVASQVNLHVFCDGPRDPHPNSLWRNRVDADPKGTEPETWHWPERE